MKTASWFTPMPEGHIKIGISRGVPRNLPAGYRVYRKLAPGAWFNSVPTMEFDRLYRKEILDPLDPKIIANEIINLSRGLEPVLVCFERVGGPQWCHRALTADWLSQAVGPIYELGFEGVPNGQHPLYPEELRHVREPEKIDLSPYIGRSVSINGVVHTVISLNHDGTQVVVQAGDRTFPTSVSTLKHYFQA